MTTVIDALLPVQLYKVQDAAFLFYATWYHTETFYQIRTATTHG